MDARALERLRWRSRRGLLELDLVLDRFWSHAGMRMDEEKAAQLEALLLLPDNDLLDLVMGRAEAPDEKLRGMVDMLRAA
ncbi:MAG TPA: succinate dehydrogenase assembly factor 2 [Usitatibacter sp.]|jgi:succinate dehydrogenase flavin-adding protein (antitoxin of CptAB toxin-antitoxin module)|nr:succinate dehydrogenase assembly factor 2 [Usitatibacter sp.]